MCFHEHKGYNYSRNAFKKSTLAKKLFWLSKTSLSYCFYIIWEIVVCIWRIEVVLKLLYYNPAFCKSINKI